MGQIPRSTECILDLLIDKTLSIGDLSPKWRNLAFFQPEIWDPKKNLQVKARYCANLRSLSHFTWEKVHWFRGFDFAWVEFLPFP